MDEYQHLERLLDTKLDGFLTLLKLELNNIKKDVAEIAEELGDHKEHNQDDVKQFRESVVRLHTRVDEIEKRVSNPPKMKIAELIRVKAVEWAVPIFMLFGLWLITSGSLLTFFGKVVK